MRNFVVSLACLIILPLDRDSRTLATKGPDIVQIRPGGNRDLLGDSPRTAISARDRETLAVVLRDLLDPLNPVYDVDAAERSTWPSEIVVDTSTTTMREDFGADALRNVASEHDLPNDLVKNWTVRNSTDAGSIAPWENRPIGTRLVDLDKLETNAAEDFGAAFRSRFPVAIGYVQPYLPAYGENGTRAVVVVSVGPSGHPIVWVHHLRRDDRGWHTVWRCRQVFE